MQTCSITSSALGRRLHLAGQLLHDDAAELVAAKAFANMNEALCWLWKHFLHWWSERGYNVSRQPVFTMRTISCSTAADFPRLIEMIKGSWSKHITTWACNRTLEVAAMKSASEYQKQRGCLAYSWLGYVNTCDNADLLFTDDEAEAAQTHGIFFLQWYQHLAYTAWQRGKTAWRLRPKLHYFAECVLEISDTKENPAKHALWGSEDLVGQAKKVGRHCHKRTASNRVAQRRSIFVLMRARAAAGKVRKQMAKKNTPFSRRG